MLLAEDLLLLVTDDASGRLSVPGVQAVRKAIDEMMAAVAAASAAATATTAGGSG